MSYDISMLVHNRRVRADMDCERMTFLERLDESDLMLNDWESEFVGNYIAARSEGRGQNWFTYGRRNSTDKMRMKYEGELKLLTAKTQASPEATPRRAPRPNERSYATPSNRNKT